eukprot:1178900-Prorocentrum_minimum.AAC.4
MRRETGRQRETSRGTVVTRRPGSHNRSRVRFRPLQRVASRTGSLATTLCLACGTTQPRSRIFRGACRNSTDSIETLPTASKRLATPDPSRARARGRRRQRGDAAAAVRGVPARSAEGGGGDVARCRGGPEGRSGGRSRSRSRGGAAAEQHPGPGAAPRANGRLRGRVREGAVRG